MKRSDDLRECLGAKYGWLWDQWDRVYVWCFRYWPPVRNRRKVKMKSKIKASTKRQYEKRLERRGRHWQRQLKR